MARIWVKDLCELFADEDETVRAAAATVVGALGLADKPVIDALVRMAMEGPPSQSVVALQALARIGSPTAANALLPLLKSAAREVRAAAQKAVIAAGSEGVSRAARPRRLLRAAKKGLGKLVDRTR